MAKHHIPKKPAKPYDDFPLFPHATKRWAKKIKGKMYYFGPWDDWQGSLAKFEEQKEDLFAGRKPRGTPGAGVTIRELLNRFLTAKKQLQDEGTITARTFGDYHVCCERLKSVFGLSRLVSDLASDDFEKLRATLSKTLGPVALSSQILRVRTVFKFAFESDMIERPIKFGPHFKSVPKKVLRIARATRGSKMFEADELRKMIDAADQPLKAMILLGINCGFGNSDIGQLPLSALDLDKGWVNYPRPKTGVNRRCPLWTETVAALREAIEQRPEPKDATCEGKVFITRCRQQWYREYAGGPLGKATLRLLKATKLYRQGLSFYAIRHTLETIGGETLDQPAVDTLMGHERPDMATVYRERIEDARLIAVSNHVHKWLFGK